jgi:transposase
MKLHKRTIQLSKEELAHVQNITRKGKHNSRVINRARVLQYSNAGQSKSIIASVLSISDRTVQRIRDNYRDGGLDRALSEAPRPGQPKKLDDKAEAHLVALACSDPPEGREHWTLKLLKKQMTADGKVTSISDVCILSYLNNRGLKPWREKNVVRTEAHA